MDYLADKIDKLATGEESSIDLSAEEVGESSIGTGDPEPENLEPLPEITPSESTLEETKTPHQDESLLKPPEPLNEAKIEEGAIEAVGESSALKPLLQKELATRLGVSTSAISHKRKKGDDEFKEWSKGKDPDGWAWEYNSETKTFSPVAETPS